MLTHFLLLSQNVDATLGVYGKRIDFAMNARFEALVNNLVFLVPEPFIQPVHLAFSATKYPASPIYEREILSVWTK